MQVGTAGQPQAGERGADPGRVCAIFRVRAYSPLVRIVAAALLTVSGVTLPLLLLGVLFSTDPPLLPVVLIQLYLFFSAIPAGCAWLIARAADADVQVYAHELVVRRRRLRVEVPTAAIARVRPWWVPLPGPGVTLRLRSGRRLRLGLQLADPAALAEVLASVAGVEKARGAAAHPLLVYARARAAVRWRWYHYALKFVVFGLLPTAVLFNAHQHIAYGGLLGQYYLLGLRAYLTTFAIYWATVTIDLVLFAAVWRALVAMVCLVAAAVAPSRAARVRRLAEITGSVGYYLGVPTLLALRFLS